MRLSFLIFLSTIAVTCGFDLKCSFEDKQWTFLGSIKTCVTIGLIVSNSNESVTSINGNKKIQNDVFGFSVDSQTFNYFPRDIEVFLPNLKGITIDNSKLMSIRSTQLKPFPNLISLVIYNNQIEILPDNLFAYNPELKRINFNWNSNLRAVGENIIPDSVKEAYFQSSGCINNAASEENQIPELRAKIEQNCEKTEKLKRRLFSEEFDALDQTVKDLKSQLISLQRSFDSCDGNLNAATKNMLDNNSRSIEVRTVDFSCENRTVDCEDNEFYEELICNVVDLKIPESNIAINNIFTKMNINLVKSLIISKQQTLYLPTNIQVFPALIALNVTFSGLSEIEENIFLNVTNLQALNLEGNKLREIALKAFDHLVNLVNLDLSRNQIERLDDGAFDHLRSLEYLNLSRNLLTTINGNIFGALTSIKSLDLNNNKLKFISTDMFLPLKKIEHVDFSNNICIDMNFPNSSKELIVETLIEKCVLPVDLNCKNGENNSKLEKGTCRVQNLIILYPHTRISQVHLSEGKDNSQITSLNVADQSMRFMLYKLSTTFPNLENIFVHRSKLSLLSKIDFEDFTQLKTIVITQNNLKTIEEGTFDHLSQLELLDLSFNDVVALPTKIFQPLKNIRHLILSSNQIEKFYASFLPFRSEITEFKVDDNKLWIIEPQIIGHLRKAKKIDLSGNNCIDRKFDNTGTRKDLFEFSVEINLMCSPNDLFFKK